MINSPTPTPSTRRFGAAIVVAGGLALAAIGVGSVALVQSTSTSTADRIVLDAPDVVASEVPTTITPTAPTTSPGRAEAPAPDTQRVDEARERTTADANDTNDTTPGPNDTLSNETASPLAELLGPTYSVVPEPLTPRPQPVGLAIDAIDVDEYPIRAVGLEPDGQLEVPDETEIGWYRYGATAGRPGATVLAAHVSWNGTTGPFFELGSLEPGNQVSVALDDGTIRQYVVTERTMYDKNELPRERIWRNTGDETLVLITCGGDFNPEIRRYRQNIVVYAVPVA
ncbi:MAG: class F sortase [Ilumatobacter sp.]|uniref:class F sortase n=1 Tax=Ilumatobacter sp. TaxID=1967498 RepID=UPI0039189037